MRAREIQLLFVILGLVISAARPNGDYPFIVNAVDSAGDEAVVSIGTMTVKSNPNKA